MSHEPTASLPTCHFPTQSAGLDASYALGEWVPGRARPYTINTSLWEKLGTSIRRSTPQHYGRCDEVKPDRALYEWRPSGCSLRAFSRERVCEKLRGRTLLMVGDSTVFQAFLSFALLMDARLGKNPKKASTVSELTASACGDATRLVFVRSDLLLHTTTGTDFRAVQRCDGFTNLQIFAQRAVRDADILVLGLGHHVSCPPPLSPHTSPWRASDLGLRAHVRARRSHRRVRTERMLMLMQYCSGGVHACSVQLPTTARMKHTHRILLPPFCWQFPGSLGAAEANQRRRAPGSTMHNAPVQQRMALHAFFPQNLNHTLSALITRRAELGHASPTQSMLLLGTTTPVSGCSRFDAPISLDTYVRANYDHRRHVDSPMWLDYARMNGLAKWLASSHRIHFLDLAAPSAMRPDGAMARFWRGHGPEKIKEDCVHYCMPGVVDAWSTLVYNWLLGTHQGTHHPSSAGHDTDGTGKTAVEDAARSAMMSRTAGGGGLSAKLQLKMIEELNEAPLDSSGRLKDDLIRLGTTARDGGGGGAAGSGGGGRLTVVQAAKAASKSSRVVGERWKWGHGGSAGGNSSRRLGNLTWWQRVGNATRRAERAEQRATKQASRQETAITSKAITSSILEMIGRRLKAGSKKSGMGKAADAPLAGAQLQSLTHVGSGLGGPLRSRFFSVPLERWLNERGVSASFERCDAGNAPCMPLQRLSRQVWWPFNCSG